MRVITIRSQIRDVSKRWDETYRDRERLTLDKGYNAEIKVICERLAALDLETATAAEIAAIIGNDTWVEPKNCDECSGVFGTVIEIGEKPNWESRTAYVCCDCLHKAYSAACDAS